MMSVNRDDYASADEWLSALRQDDAWLYQKQQLQESATCDICAHRDDALRRIGNGITFEYWKIYKHKVEPVVGEVWGETGLTLPMLKMQVIGMLSMEWLEQHACDGRDLPEKLKTDEAKEVMKKLVKSGLLTEDWRPKDLSGTERALVAKVACEHLNINDVWQVFGQLWGEKPETLRSYLNKALEQKKSLKFQEKLKRIFS